MCSQLIGAIVNIVLDPIFIFGYCGEALSGTTGAAVATVVGQFCGAGAAVFFNLKKNPDIQLDWHASAPAPMPSSGSTSLACPALRCSASQRDDLPDEQDPDAFSATAVAVFGVYFKLQSFVFMPIFGMNNGMVPIISYNYGARNPDRVKKTIKLAMCYAEASCSSASACSSLCRTSC